MGEKLNKSINYLGYSLLNIFHFIIFYLFVFIWFPKVLLLYIFMLGGFIISGFFTAITKPPTKKWQYAIPIIIPLIFLISMDIVLSIFSRNYNLSFVSPDIGLIGTFTLGFVVAAIYFLSIVIGKKALSIINVKQKKVKFLLGLIYMIIVVLTLPLLAKQRIIQQRTLNLSDNEAVTISRSQPESKIFCKKYPNNFVEVNRSGAFSVDYWAYIQSKKNEKAQVLLRLFIEEHTITKIYLDHPFDNRNRLYNRSEIIDALKKNY